jgi:tRNA threonylcarbamoyladenosine biosynthesis protein TsaE
LAGGSKISENLLKVKSGSIFTINRKKWWFMSEIKISNSEEETKQIGRDFATKLTKNSIVVLNGELGSGKTKFVEGILSAFNLESEISSPTFTIVNEYSNEYANVYHFDVYRLQNAREFELNGFTEYFGKGICIIEWGEIIEDVLPNNAIIINFSKDSFDENKRTIEILLE